MVAGEIRPVDFIYLRKQAHITQENGCFYDVPESEFCFVQHFTEVLHYLVRFGLEAAHFKFAGGGDESDLPADKYKPVCFYRLAVGTDRRWRFFGDDDLFWHKIVLISSNLLHFYQPANLNLRFMYIVVKADEEQKAEFLAKGFPAELRVDFLTDDQIPQHADAYFDLCFEEVGAAFAGVKQTVFVNAVIATQNELPANFIRINAWNGFLKREMIEIVATASQLENATMVLQALQWKFQTVPDVPGMIAARVIAMIVNEAYFGLGDEISSKKDIDTAMKLGTNYPYGPFEWSEKIGLKKIASLLKKLSTQDDRYLVAPALEKELIISN
jgi:3-hydroxybutyryl-CoA dehydrogenase